MTLCKDTNYIVSGLERSGTSMLMQILHKGGADTSFDDGRKTDENNPQGYYELENGKIINRLIKHVFPFDDHLGKFIKITCYGLKYLPERKYKIIYSERNIDEILDSMEKMTNKKDPKRYETREVFLKLNEVIKKQIQKREHMDLLFVNYNKILQSPHENIKKIYDFLDDNDLDLEKMMGVVDRNLYRQRK